MSQLVLGTAEFHPAGYAGKPPIALREIRRIFSLAKEAGINILDTAESYDCSSVIREEARGFCIYTKTRDWKVTLNWGDNELRAILYHYSPLDERIQHPFIHRWVNLGSSVYTVKQLPVEDTRIVQIPYNLMDDTFEACFEKYRTVFVRSVFARGELLKRHSLRDCLSFVRVKRPCGVIVGVNTHKELEEILKAWEAVK